MSEQTYRERWRREVFRTALITDSVRVALLALADDMDGDGMVSVDRSELAGKLARSDRRVGERFTSAIAAGLLERVSRGQRNGRGRYRAALPGDPSSGRTGVPKTTGVFRTDGGPEENSLQDGLQVEETSCLQDGRGSRRSSFDPSVFGTDGGPEEPAPYRGTARAHSKHGDRNHQNPVTAGTDTTIPDETNTRVSQSARKREGFRYLNDRYGLTEFEAASVVVEVTRRAPQPIRSLVPYLAAMKEGDLADIVAAIQSRTDNTDSQQPNPPGEESRTTGRPPWCGNCDEPSRMIDLVDGRVARCPICHPLREETA